MAYLMKFKGKYRLKTAIDKITNDFPRDENGMLEQNDIYIDCMGGSQITHYGRSTLMAYIPSLGRGHNILIAIAKELNVPEDRNYEVLYSNLEKEGTIKIFMIPMVKSNSNLMRKILISLLNISSLEHQVQASVLSQLKIYPKQNMK